MYLLDTNVVSELRRARPHGAVENWFKVTPSRQIFVSAVTFGEIQTGIEITRDRDAPKAEEIEAWLRGILDTFVVVPIDTPIFREWARLKHRKNQNLFFDAMIAATAIVNGLTVVTRNVRDFEQFNVTIYNPFENA